VCEHWNGEHSLYPGVGMCTECELQEATINMLHCSTCGQYCHRHCTGVGKRGIPAGVYTCASCLQSRAKLPNNALAQKLSKELLQLTAQPVQLQSQDTYYYALKRFQKFTEELSLSREQVFPIAPGEGMDTLLIKYFLVWAKDKYAPNTIQLTLSAISDWHRSKDLSQTSKERQEIGVLMRTLKIKLGVDGKARQKQGVSIDLFQLLLTEVNKLRIVDAVRKGLYLRNQAYLLLSFFGFLRRSEALALKLKDLSVRRTTQGKLYLHVLIRKSKTDVFSKGVELCIAYTSNSGIQIVVLM
jgi:integrase